MVERQRRVDVPARLVNEALGVEFGASGQDRHADNDGNSRSQPPKRHPSSQPGAASSRNWLTAETAIEDVAQELLAAEDARQRHGMMGQDRQATLGRVGCGRERVDGGDVEGKLDAPHAGQVDGEAQEVGAMGEGREPPREGQTGSGTCRAARRLRGGR